MMKFAIVLLLLAGCTLPPKKTIPVAVYDFGPPAPVEQHTPTSVDYSILPAKEAVEQQSKVNARDA